METPGEEKTVWLRPTERSPACKFVVSPKTQRALSSCRVWLAAIPRGRPAAEFGKDLCPLCAADKVADGVLVKRK